MSGILIQVLPLFPSCNRTSRQPFFLRMDENVLFPDAEQDIFGPCESSCSHLWGYLSPHLSPLKRFIHRGSGDKGESMRDKNLFFVLKGKHTEVSGITSGNNENSSPNLCSQFGKNSRHKREDVPKKSNLFLHICSRETTRTFT